MTRTQIYLPEELHGVVKNVAQANGISMAEFVRQSLEESTRKQAKQFSGQPKKKLNKTALAFLSLAGVVKGGPRDGGVNHDYYLYGGSKKY